MMRSRRNTLGSFSKKDEQPQGIYHVGLVNLGNSCFYNTILQALAVSQPLEEIILSPPATSPALLALSPASPSYNPEPSNLLSPLPITSALLALLARLDLSKDEARGKKVFNPKALLRQMSLKHEEYAEATQQDAHEMLRHLIDGIMMEEVDLIKKVRASRPPPPKPRPNQRRRMTIRGPDSSRLANDTSMTPVREESEHAFDDEDDEDDDDDDDEDDDVESSEGDDDSSSSSDSSSSDDEDSEAARYEIGPDGKRQLKMEPFISTVFEGKLASVVICDECKHVRETTEPFMDFSLSLRDDAADKARRRGRLRRTFGAALFGSKKNPSNESVASVSSNGSNASRNQPHASLSLSETDASTSASEAESDAEADARKPRSRHASLDPSKLPSNQRHSGWAAPASSSKSRDPSPLGRALSVLSSRSGDDGGRRSRRPKIPKPTAEQVAYIRKVLVEIPGAPPPSLPPQLRFARPPNSKAPPSPPSSSASASSVSTIAVEQMSTDLYECFRQFTSVEVLEGDNAFACKNCWKHLNPDLVRKRQEAKDTRRRAKALRKLERKKAKHQSYSVAEGTNKTGSRTAVNSPEHSPELAENDRLSVASGVAVPSIKSTAPSDEVVHNELSPTFASLALESNPSLLSEPSLVSENGTSASESMIATDDEGTGGLADVEDGNNTDIASLSEVHGQEAIPAHKDPLTVENVEKLDPLRRHSNTITALPAAPSLTGGQSLAATKSGASISTRLSGASSKIGSSVASKPSATPSKPPRHILRRAHKRYLISARHLPPVLVIHLKRFQNSSKTSLFGGTSFTNLKKRDDDLTFPQDLDLTPFLAPLEKPPKRSTASASHHRRRASSTVSPESTTIAPEKIVGGALYRLYAAVVHYGTLSTGHYSAFVLSNRYGHGARGSEKRQWFFCSDEDVHAVSVEEVLKCKAYILFYERALPEQSVLEQDIVEEPVPLKSQL